MLVLASMGIVVSKTYSYLWSNISEYSNHADLGGPDMCGWRDFAIYYRIDITAR